MHTSALEERCFLHLQSPIQRVCGAELSIPPPHFPNMGQRIQKRAEGN